MPTLQGRYIKLKNNSVTKGHRYVICPQVFVYDHNDVNIALDKPTSASSQLDPNSGPELINNGVFSDASLSWGSSGNPNGYFAHTGANVDPWDPTGPEEYIKIDLQQDYYIKSIVVWHRSGWRQNFIGGYYSIEVIKEDNTQSLDYTFLNSENANNTFGDYDPPPPPPPTLDFFQIDPSNITVENHGTINMTFSDDRITNTDISNSLTVDPSNAGVIDNINETSTGSNIWTADFTPNYGLDLTDCSLNFIYTDNGANINQTKKFNIETYIQQIKNVILAPENIITDLSSNLEVVLRLPTGDIAPTISIDPSYIANLDGNMTSSDGGLTWNGSINRTLGMNLLGNTLTVTSGDISSNIAFDVLENENLRIEWIEGEYDNITVFKSSEKYAFAFSRDGKTFAYGGGRTGFTGNLVTIYKYINMSWNSYDIVNTTGYFAHAVSLSDDGSKLVVGAPHNYLNDRVFIYNLTDTNYTQLREYSFDNTPLSGNKVYQNMGRCVSISGNGNYIFFGNKYTRPNQNGKLYQIAWNAENGTEIVLNTIGNSTVTGTNTMNAEDVDCSEDGSIVIVGNNDRFYTYGSSTKYGCVHVFKNGTLKNTFYGTSYNDYYGALVCCSPDGLKVAFTSPGKIHIKHLNSNGGLVSSKQINKYPSGIIFSNDNNKLFIASGNSCYTYEYDGSNWNEDVGNRVEYTGAKFFYKTDNNLIQMYGHINGILLRVYENIVIRQLSSQITLDPSNIEYPNTTSNFHINFTTNDKTFDDISGNVSLTSSGVSNIDTSSLALANYGFRLEGNIVANPYSKDDTNKLEYYETVDISGESVNFTINTVPVFGLIGCTLTPENLVDTYASATLRIEFNTPITDSSPNFNFTLDPSYIATLGPMSDVSSGFVWEGTLTRTPNMNKLGNKLDFDFSYNGVEVSANLVYDVVENTEDNTWSLINSNSVNKEFNKSIQMSSNGLLMGFIDGSNVEIYRKLDTSYTWNHDVSYNGHTFALTNNHIALANENMLQIYDYSGSSWSIMNEGNIYYLNIIALSINLDGTYVAISNNIDVKVLQNISDNWTHINTYTYASVNGLSLSPNGLKLGMGIGTVGQDYSSILVEDVVNNHPPVITIIGDAIINHEINSGSYTDQGATAIDEASVDLTGSIVVSGDTVDVAVLGAYQIYYDVVDARGNNAVRKIRVVNVVDTTNPVVTLIGDAEITINLGDSYTEQGATATDNSLETLTVVITGSVDTSVVNDYVLTYTATDSNSNVHAITRLIHVVGLTLQWDISSVDIYTLVDAYSVCNQNPTHTQNTSTVTTGPTYLQGDYIYNCSTIQNNSALMKFAFDNGNNIYASINTAHHIITTSHLYVGNLTGFTDGGYAYDFTNNGIYIGKTIDNGTYAGPIYFSHQDYLTNIYYDGEFLETIFPFFVELTQMSFTHFTSTFSPKQMVFMASEDGGLNYIHIETFNSPGVSYVANYTSTTKYNAFKVILTEATSAGHVFTMKNWKCYGKIYT